MQDSHPAMTVMALALMLLLGVALLIGVIPITAAKDILHAAFSGVLQ